MKPPKDDDKLPDEEAERRFNDSLRRLVNTPHRPHKPAVAAPKKMVGK